MIPEKLQPVLDSLELHYLELVEDFAAELESFEDIPSDELSRLMAYKRVIGFDGYEHKAVESEIEDDFYRSVNELSVAAAERAAEFAADEIRELSEAQHREEKLS